MNGSIEYRWIRWIDW